MWLQNSDRKLDISSLLRGQKRLTEICNLVYVQFQLLGGWGLVKHFKKLHSKHLLNKSTPTDIEIIAKM